MSQALFTQLIETLCETVGIKLPEPAPEGYPIAVDEVDFLLAYDETTDPDTLSVYCDFGQPAEEGAPMMYEALLNTNRIIYGSHSPTFMLSENKHVMLAYHHHLEEIEPEGLKDLLGMMTGHAKEWRQQHFLQIAPASNTGISMSSGKNAVMQRRLHNNL